MHVTEGAEWRDTSDQSRKSRWLWPRPLLSCSHMAGWRGSSSKASGWLDMTDHGRGDGGRGGERPGERRVYWNRVTFVAEWPAAAQKENPGNTVDYLTLCCSAWTGCTYYTSKPCCCCCCVSSGGFYCPPLFFGFTFCPS